MTSVVLAVLLGLLVLIVVLAVLVIIAFYIFHRRSVERQRREEEQILKDDDTQRMHDGAVPDAPEITISEWQSKPSNQIMTKYGSTGDESLENKPKSKGTQQKALSTKHSDPGPLESISLKSKPGLNPPSDVTEEPTKFTESNSDLRDQSKSQSASDKKVEHSTEPKPWDRSGRTSTAKPMDKSVPKAEQSSSGSSKIKRKFEN